MIRRFLLSLLLGVGLLAPALPALAQEQSLEAPPETEQTLEGESAAPETAPAEVPPPETAEESFERIAHRAEELAANEDASLFALNRLRAELVNWRDHYLAETEKNAGRIATVDAQIAALGPAPEDGQEPQAVADRRSALIEQRHALVAPRLLAEESYVRAEGLIREFDARALQRETEELTQRGPTPLNPTAAQEAMTAVAGLFGIVATELSVGITAGMADGSLSRILPRALLLLVVGIGLLSMGRSFVTGWRARLSGLRGRWVPLYRFFVSFAQILVPLVGLYAVTEALALLGIFGLRGSDIVSAIPYAGFCAIFGWWLSRQLFPLGSDSGYLEYDPETRAKGRFYVKFIAWVSAIAVLIEAGLRTVELSEAGLAATEWPILVVLGILLWRLGAVVKTPPMPAEDGHEVSAGRNRLLVGRFCTAVAVISPTIAAIGYGFAGENLMSASLLTLGLMAVVFLVQRITRDLLERPLEDEDNRGLYALLPVLVSFVLFALSAPLFALIWGARVDDLLEIWARFREGFAIGETRLSPMDFLWFVIVFALGYLLTRFVQGLLRRSVLPRTRLDLGAQNAVVAGFGYVGIILASIFAITTAGIDLSSLAIVAGALSVGIGFGLQNIVSNFVSGIILLIERPVSEGDWIEVGGQMGYVRSISVRSTRIETFDRRDVIIPNADLVSGQVTNWTRGNLVGRVIVPVGVAYGTDTAKVTEILLDIAKSHPLVEQTPPPSVVFQGFGADSLDFEIRAILTDVNYVLATKSEMNHEIAKRFAEEGIEIPFAQRDIWLRNPEVLKG